MNPEELMARAKKVFGPVAETIGRDVLERVGPERFMDEYVKELSRITGNKNLVERILKGE